MSQTLHREYRRHSGQVPAYLEPTMEEQRKIWPSFSILGPEQLLELLYDLCSFQLFDLDTLQARPAFKDLGGVWRTEPLAADKHGQRYWLIGECWLYSEKIERDLWQCVAHDLASWNEFMNNNPFVKSRRAVDKTALDMIRKEVAPLVEPILQAEERRQRTLLKKEHQEMQRMLFAETRRRSSRVVAQERIRNDALASQESSQSKGTPSPSKPEKRQLSREERIALRHEKMIKQEERKIIEQLMEDDEDAEKDETEEKEKEGDQMLSPSECDEIDVERSPIKLFVKIGPHGSLSSQLFIGDQPVRKENGTNGENDSDDRSPDQEDQTISTLNITDDQIEPKHKYDHDPEYDHNHLQEQEQEDKPSGNPLDRLSEAIFLETFKQAGNMEKQQLLPSKTTEEQTSHSHPDLGSEDFDLESKNRNVEILN